LSTPHVVIGLTLAGGVLRFLTLGQGLWFDEVGQVREVAGSFGHLWHSVAREEMTPPLYSVCLWLWRHVFGLDVFALRSFSALFGTLTIPVGFLAADRLVGRRAALIVAALTATGPIAVYYSQEVRAYALLIFLCAAGLLAFANVVGCGGRRWLAGWALASGLAMATHYYAALVVAPQAIMLLARSRRERGLRALLVVTLAVLGLEAVGLALLLRFQVAHVDRYLMGVIGSTLRHQDDVIGVGSVSTVPQEFFLGPGGPFKALSTAALIAISALGVTLAVRRREEPRGLSLVLVMLLPATAWIAAAEAFHQQLHGRHLLAVWMPLTVVVAAGFAELARRRLRIVVVVTAVGLSLAIAVLTAAVPRFAGREDVATPAAQIGAATTERLVAIDERWDLLALRFYRPDASVAVRSPVRVRELDVLAMPARDFPADTDADRPPRPVLPGLPRRLRLRSVILGPTFVIERYESPTPVTLALLPEDGVFPVSWRFLVERPGARFAPPS
jgi:4-amino-4-deoxy-L-arabinose transferase-like glycosyltransferase